MPEIVVAVSVSPNPAIVAGALAVATGRETGVMRWFNIDRGFGFAAVPGRDKDVFVHITEMKRSKIVVLDEGDVVTFVPKETPRGVKATEIRLDGSVGPDEGVDDE